MYDTVEVEDEAEAESARMMGAGCRGLDGQPTAVSRIDQPTHGTANNNKLV